MSGVDAFRIAALALRQADRIDALSRALLAVSVLAAFAVALVAGRAAGLALAAIAASAAAGLVQLAFAMRVGFDAGLLRAVAGLPPAAAAERIDAGLSRLGLRAASASARDWDARRTGIRRLAGGQLGALLLQIALLVVAVGVAAATGRGG